MLYRVVFIFLIVSASVWAQHTGDLNNRFMLAQSYEQAGDLDKAKSILEELIKVQPQNYQFFDALNRVYINSKDYDKSAGLIEKRLAVNPHDLNLWGMLGTTYHIMGNEEKAFETWDEALKTLPKNQVNYKVIANFALQRRAFEKAVEYLQKGKEISNDSKMFSYDLGNLYSITMQYKEAAEEYSDIIIADPNQLRSVESRIMSYINKPGALEPTLIVFRDKLDEKNISLIYMLARLYMEADDYEKAYELYLSIDEKQQNQGTELFNFAQIAYSENKFDAAAGAFNDLVEKYPNSPLASNAKLGYAKTLEASLHKEYNSLLPLWKTYYKPVEIEADKIENVTKAYNNIISLYPHSEQAYEAYLQLGRMKLYMQNNLADAEQYFKKIVDEAPLSSFYPGALIGLADIRLIKGNTEEAEKFYQKVTEAKRIPAEEHNEANFNLAKILFSRGLFNEAREKLQIVTTNLKDNTANDAIELSLLMNTQMNDSSKLVVFAAAELLAAGGRFEEAIEKYKSITGDERSLMLAELAKIRTAEMMTALNLYEEAKKILDGFSNEEDENIYADKALYLLAKIYHFGTGEKDLAIDTYEKLLARYPSSLYLDEAREAIINLRKTS